MKRITSLFKIKYPIIQGGMVWCSGWRLAAAVSNAGGLGLLGAGSMYPEVLETHIRKCKAATQKPFGVNLPLLYPDLEAHIRIIVREKIPIVFTSAGNPKKWTSLLKSEGIVVVHVVSSVKFAIKAVSAGVDAIVAEGFEAGGHNGREETTTLCLLPMVRAAVNVPLLAAGGIASGKAMLAALALGAEGVQVGSYFAVTEESSAHLSYKQKIIQSQEGDTVLCLKKLTPVRLLKNEFYERLAAAEKKEDAEETLVEILGKGRAKKGIFEGDLVEGKIEIGQVAAGLNKIIPAEKAVEQLWQEFLAEKKRLDGYFV